MPPIDITAVSVPMLGADIPDRLVETAWRVYISGVYEWTRKPPDEAKYWSEPKYRKAAEQAGIRHLLETLRDKGTIT